MNILLAVCYCAQDLDGIEKKVPAIAPTRQLICAQRNGDKILVVDNKT